MLQFHQLSQYVLYSCCPQTRINPGALAALGYRVPLVSFSLDASAFVCLSYRTMDGFVSHTLTIAPSYNGYLCTLFMALANHSTPLRGNPCVAQLSSSPSTSQSAWHILDLLWTKGQLSQYLERLLCRILSSSKESVSINGAPGHWRWVLHFDKEGGGPRRGERFFKYFHKIESEEHKARPPRL